jgi:hypothetical protein
MSTISVENLNQGDILLYHGKSWISKAIRFFDGTDYNHVSIYMGNHIVAEALENGIITQRIDDSIKNSEYVIAKRLNNCPQNMDPVMDIVLRYKGKRYAYEQLLLLAFICIFRKVNLNYAVARFIKKLLEIAASLLVEFMNADKQALICSEFVFRCYDEAEENNNDPYTIVLQDMHPLSIAKLSKKRNSKQPAPVYPQSIFSLFYYNAIHPSSNTKSKYIISFNPVDIHTIPAFNQDLIEPHSELHHLFEEVKNNYQAQELLEKASLDTHLKDSLDMFITAHYFANILQASNKTPSNDFNLEIIKSFYQTNANFVTPGDLFRAKNLELIGTIQG